MQLLTSVAGLLRCAGSGVVGGKLMDGHGLPEGQAHHCGCLECLVACILDCGREQRRACCRDGGPREEVRLLMFGVFVGAFVLAWCLLTSPSQLLASLLTGG